MHQLALPRLSALVGALALFAVPASAQTAASVQVLYAGSLVTPMEGPVKAALAKEGLDFQGEPGGSKKLANLIASGVRAPDAFVAVDPEIVASLGDRVLRSTTFASTRLGIAWPEGSKYAVLFERVGESRGSLADAIETVGLRIGRTDPRLDPKGAYTVQAVTLWLGASGERALLGADGNPDQVFPEEDLLVRLETGQADVGFFYETEAVARGYRFLALPGKADLSDKIRYALAVMRAAPHPAQAAAFETFLLRGPGRRILEKAGLHYSGG